MELPESLENVVKQMRKIPGVGEKTALRQVLTLCRWEKKDLLEFGESLIALGGLNSCPLCGFYTNGGVCEICKDESRQEESSLCIVENISDFMAIEKSGTFYGVYHILGGVLNPLLGIGPNDLRLNQLVERIKKENIREVILAVNPSVEGDATCSYINDALSKSVDVQRIGFGVPIGGSLEYLDAMTISKALENRKRLDS